MASKAPAEYPGQSGFSLDAADPAPGELLRGKGSAGGSGCLTLPEPCLNAVDPLSERGLVRIQNEEAVQQVEILLIFLPQLQELQHSPDIVRITQLRILRHLVELDFELG
jgi:hypothetical protein